MIFDNKLQKKIISEFPHAQIDACGMKRVFLDNGTGTQVLKRSVDAEYNAALKHSANVGPSFPESRKSTELIHEGLKAVADLLNTESPENILSGQSATCLLFALSYALGKECNKKSNIVTTYYEHLSNVDPWRELAQRGVIQEVRFTNLHEDGTLNLEHIRSIVDENTKVITVSAASNLLGSKSSLKEISNIAQGVGAYYVIDGVHHTAHGYMDVQEIDCDFLVISAYKCFSPRYTGFLYGKKEHLESMRSYVAGKNHCSLQERWEWGTPDHSKMAAIKATVDYFEWLGNRVADRYEGRFIGSSGRVRSLKIAMDAIDQYEKEISQAFLNGFEDVPGLPDIENVSFYGLRDTARLDERDPTFAFSIDGMTGHEVERHLVDDFNIAIRSIEYWSMAEDFFSIDKPIRASFVHYNTLDEVRFFLNAVRKICEG